VNRLMLKDAFPDLFHIARTTKAYVVDYMRWNNGLFIEIYCLSDLFMIRSWKSYKPFFIFYISPKSRGMEKAERLGLLVGATL
jgi:hypothetical protein